MIPRAAPERPNTSDSETAMLNGLIFFGLVALGSPILLRWLKAAADRPDAVGKVIDKFRKL